jgi:hypothetical protein
VKPGRLVLALPILAACVQVPRPVLPGDIPVDVRVRVVAPTLPPGWHPAHLVLSSEGCRIVTVATAPEDHPVVNLNMGQIQRLQLSEANPPPDWWAEPEESEGWIDFALVQLRQEPERCRKHYPAAPSPPRTP